jgi:hypothetical protein
MGGCTAGALVVVSVVVVEVTAMLADLAGRRQVVKVGKLDSSCVRFVLKGRSEQRQVCGGDRQIGQEDSMRLCYRQWRSGDVSLGYR